MNCNEQPPAVENRKRVRRRTRLRLPSEKKPEPAQRKLTFEERLAACGPIEDALKLLGIERWDYLVIGDGSGSVWDQPCGWGSTLIDNGSFTRQSFWGASSHGTNNVAEMEAFLQPLQWIANNNRRYGRGTNVHVLTDSQLVASCGNGKQSRKANLELWAKFTALQRRGLVVTFHWVPRNVLDLSKLADELAKTARKAMPGLNVRALKKVAPSNDCDDSSIYGLNQSVE